MSKHLVSFFVGTLGLYGVASAQEMPLEPEQLAKLELRDMSNLGQRYAEEISDMSSDTLEMLRQGQQANDVQVVQCVSKVLNAMKAMVRLAEQYRLSLQQAIIAGDRSAATQEFIKLAMARSRIREWHAQAKGCGGPGAELVFEGEPQVEKKLDPDLPAYDPTTGLDMPELFAEAPPSVSPFY